MRAFKEFVKSVYPNARCITHYAPIGNSYQVLYGTGKSSAATYFFGNAKDAWKQAAERISKTVIMKLEL